MSHKQSVILSIILMLILNISIFSETEKTTVIKNLGKNPLLFKPKGKKTIDVLKSLNNEKMLNEDNKLNEENKKRIKDGFKQIEGFGEAFGIEFINNLSKAGSDLKEEGFNTQTKLKWMFFYVNNRTRVVWNPVLELNKSEVVNGFYFNMTFECITYKFIFLEPCGNLCLIDKNFAIPECKIKMVPENGEINVGESVTIDLSGSTCANTFEITILKDGVNIDQKTLECGERKWTRKFDVEGTYKIIAKLMNKNNYNINIYDSNKIIYSFTLNAVIKEWTTNKEFNNLKLDVTPITPPNIEDVICEKFITVKGIPSIPECSIFVNPKKDYVGKNFTFDASSSKIEKGKIEKIYFLVEKNGDKPRDISAEDIKREGDVVEKPPFIIEKSMYIPGVYTVHSLVIDSNQHESKLPCNAEFTVIQKRFCFIAELGPMIAKGTYTGFIFGRLGFTYFIVPEKLSFLFTSGYAINLGGDAFKNHFLSNYLINAHFKRFFIGGGLGLSGKVRDAVIKKDENIIEWKSDFDIVGNLGYDVLKKKNKTYSIFGEIRIPIKESLTFKLNHAFLLGFRIKI